MVHTVMAISIQINIHSSEFLSVVPHHGSQHGGMFTSAECPYLDPRTRRDSSESTSSLAENGKASARVQHSRRDSQGLGMAMSHVTIEPLAQESECNCNRYISITA